MKKIISSLAVLLAAASLAGCGDPTNAWVDVDYIVAGAPTTHDRTCYVRARRASAPNEAPRLFDYRDNEGYTVMHTKFALCTQLKVGDRFVEQELIAVAPVASKK